MKFCSRCGRCCLYILNGIEKRCRFLIGEIGKKTSCRIYRNRIGAKVDEGITCIEMKYFTEKVHPGSLKGCTLLEVTESEIREAFNRGGV